jgi:translation initiation factor 3 subunit I
MRPLSLKGHDRALTRVRLNREGDLLFSSAKDKSPCVWFVENGERLGTFDVSSVFDHILFWEVKENFP